MLNKRLQIVTIRLTATATATGFKSAPTSIVTIHHLGGRLKLRLRMSTYNDDLDLCNSTAIFCIDSELLALEGLYC
eukprot:scaffold2012_cov181-Chaetoceros_neogracile.AAC.1